MALTLTTYATQLAKQVVKRSGLDLPQLFSQVRLSRSHRQFTRFGYRRIDGYDVTRHYGDQLLDRSFQYVQEGFIVARLQFIRRVLGEEDIRRSTFADIGDSNGIFLKALGKRGTSINMSPVVLENISGLETLQGSLPRLSLPDRSVDYVLCFETVEHLQDPIGGLRELERVARKGVFISIPWVQRTTVHPYWPDRSRLPAEQHVVECSDEDFRKLLTYTTLRLDHLEVHAVFDRPRSLQEVLVDVAWRMINRDLLCSVFRRFSIYHLIPHASRLDGFHNGEG